MNKDKANMEQKILEAAEKLFMEQGFASTTTAKIAKEAGCNQALVHYYYRTKELLFDRIYKEKMQLMVNSITNINTSGSTFEEKVVGVINAHWDFLTKNPLIVWFALRENLNGSTALVNLFIKEIRPKAVDAFSKLEKDLNTEIEKGNIQDFNYSEYTSDSDTFLSKPNEVAKMSNFLRDGINANSAVLVNVTPEDFKDSSPLAGIYFQKDLEEKAFKLGASNYFAPIQRVEDFLNNKKSEFIGEVKPSYLPGVTLSNLQEILPDFVTDTLKQSIPYFDSKLNGFADPDAILTGVETRSSSPVKIPRNENLVSNILGVYPCGEGAGYAGGIMSAAVDGIRCSIAVLES